MFFSEFFKIGVRGTRFVALVLVLATLAGTLASCNNIPFPPETSGSGTVSVTPPPETEPPQPEEIKLINTVFSSQLLKGDLPGPFTDSGETVYVSMGVPEGMGGGYREFAASSAAVADKVGLSAITAGDVISFSSKYVTIAKTENVLKALCPELANVEVTLMETEEIAMKNGSSLSVFYTFSKKGNSGVYSAYCFILSADGMSVIPFQCAFAGFSHFRSIETRALAAEIANTVTVYSEEFTIDLADGLETMSFSLYDSLPDGYEVEHVTLYSEGYLAVFTKDAERTLRVRFFGLKENNFIGEWIDIAEKASICEVSGAQDGLTVSPSYGKYYTLTGAPLKAKVRLMSKVFVDAVYSADSTLRAYIQASSGNLVVENLSTGGSNVIYYPRTVSSEKGVDVSVSIVAFTEDNSLIFSINTEKDALGFGVYKASSGSTDIYENGYTPIGCSSSALWCMYNREGEPRRISKASLNDLEKFEILYTEGGERKEGFFDNYEDIFFNSRVELNSDGNYFVFFPADDASRISVFSTRTYSCVYTTPVPNLAQVISLDDRIIVGTQGWGVLYTVILPDRSTPGGSFDPSAIKEEPNYYPNYYNLLEIVKSAVPYLYRPANGTASFASADLIYFLLNYAAEHGYAEEYIDPDPPKEETETTDVTATGGAATSASVTTSEEAVTSSADVHTGAEATSDALSGDAETGDVPPSVEKPTKRLVKIYDLKVLAWKLFGIEEDYFEDHIMEPEPEEEEQELPAETTADTTVSEEEKEEEEKKPENAYIGLTGDDYYNRETGEFIFTPGADEPSGWKSEMGGAVIDQNSNKLVVNFLLIAPDGTEINADYTAYAINDYFRIGSINVSSSIHVIDNLPRMEIDGEKYHAMWFAVEKGSNRIYYPLNSIGSTAASVSAVIRDEKGDAYRNDELVFAETYVAGTRAVISVIKNGIYDTLSVDISSGKTTLLSGRNGFADYADVKAKMEKAVKAYPYYGARLLATSPGNMRVLYLVSSDVNSLSADYYVYDMSTGVKTKLSPSLSGSKASLSKTEHYQWMGATRVRISVWETVSSKLKNTTYEWSYSGGIWVKSTTKYYTDGITWLGTGGEQPGTSTPQGGEDSREPDVTYDVTEDEYSLFSDMSGYEPKEGDLTLRELADSYFAAKAKAMAAKPGYSFNGESTYVITYRSSSYILMYEYAVYYNDKGEPAGLTKNCENECELIDGEWVWGKITLP